MAKYSNEVVYNIITKFDSSGINKLKNELNQLKQLVTNLSSGANPFGKNFSTNDVQKYHKAIDSLQTSITRCFNPSTGMLNLKQFNTELSNGTIKTKELAEVFKNTGAKGVASFNNIVTNVTKLTPAATRANSALSKMATTMANTVRWGITASIFQGFTTEISNAINYMKDLDESLTNIQMVTQSSKEDMRELALYANQAAQSLAATTTDYTNAVKVFVQEGYSTSEAQQYADLSIKMANTSEQDTATTSDQITAYRNAFQLNYEQTVQGMDKIASVANTTASSVQELMVASQRAASVAQSVGASQDQFLSSIATIESVTRQSAEEIGNGLKTIYQRFADIQISGEADDGVDYGQYSSALKKVGVDVLDESGKFKGMDQIFSELQEVWKGLDQTQKIAVGEKVAGKWQYNRFAALMDNPDYYQKAYDSTQNASGMVDIMQEDYANSVEGRLNSLQSSIEQVMSTLFDQDSVEPVLKNITDLVNGLNDLAKAAGGLTPIITALSSLMMKAFSKQIASGLTSVKNNVQTYFSGKNNMKDMEVSFAQLGLFGLNTSTYNSAVNSYDSIKGAGSQTQLAWSSAIQQLSETENEALLAEEKLQAARQKTNEAVFQGISYEETLASVEEKLSQASVSVKKYGEEINQLTEKLKKSEQNIASATNATDPGAKGRRVRFENQKAKQTKDLTNATTSQQQAKADKTRLEADKLILQAQLEIEQVAKAQLDTIKAMDPASKENLRNYKNIDSQIRLITEELKKQVRQKYLDAGITKTEREIEAEIERIRRKATAAAVEETRAAEASFAAAQKRADAERAINDLKKQGATETRLNNITTALGNVTSLVFGFQMLSEAIKTVTDDSTSLGDKISAITMQGLMGITMVLPAINSIRQALLEASAANTLFWASANKQSVLQIMLLANTKKQTNAIKLRTIATRVQAFADKYAAKAGSDVTTAARLQEQATKDLMKAQKAEAAAAAATAPIANAVSVALLGVTAAVMIGIAAYQAYSSNIEQANENLRESATTITENANSLSSSAEEWEALFETYKTTGNNSDELKSKMKELAKTTDDAGVKAAAATENYNAFAAAIQSATDEANKSAIRANWRSIDTYDLAPKVSENNMALEYGGSQYWGVLQTRKATQENRLSQLENKRDKMKEEGSNIDSSGNETSEYKELIKEIEKTKTLLTNTEKELAKDDVVELLALYKTNAELAAQTSTWTSAISGKTSTESIYEEAQKNWEIQSYLESVGKKDSYQQYEALAGLIKNPDQKQKLFLTAAQKKVESLYGDSGSDIWKVINSSGLTSSQKISFVGQLDADTTVDNIQAQIDEFETSDAAQIILSADLDTTQLETDSTKASNLSSLIDKYKENGSFTNEDVASILKDNPTQMRYLTQVEGQWVLNKNAIQEYNNALEVQEEDIKKLIGLSTTYLEDNLDNLQKNTNKMTNVDSSSIIKANENKKEWKNNNEIQDIIKNIPEVQSAFDNVNNVLTTLNQGLSDGSVSVDQYFDEYAKAYSDNNIAEIFSYIHLHSQETQQAIIDSAKTMQNSLSTAASNLQSQLKTGQTSITDYSKSLQKLTKNSLKLEAATKGYKETAEGTWELVGNESENAKEELAKFNEKYKETDKLLSKAAAWDDFNEYLTDMQDTLRNFMNEDFSLNIDWNDALNSSQFQEVVSDLSTTISSAVETDDTNTMATNMANNISAATGKTVSEVKTVLTSGSQSIQQFMLSNEQAFTATTEAAAEESVTQASQMASGITTIIQGILDYLNGVDINFHPGDNGEEYQTKIHVGDEEIPVTVPGWKISGSSSSSINNTSSEGVYEYNGKYYDGKDNDATLDQIAAYKKEKAKETIAKGFTDLIGGSVTLGDWGGGGAGGATDIPDDNSENGSGSGSGKSNDTKEHVENEWDYLEDITNDLDRASAAMEKLSNLEDRLYGKDKIANLAQLKSDYAGYIDLLEQEVDLAKQRQAEDKEKLVQFGATYDSEGNLQNGKDISESLTAQINIAIDDYNAHKDDDDTTAYQDAIDTAQDRLDKFMELYEDYQEAINTQEDAESQIQDYLQKIQDKEDEIIDSVQEYIDVRKETFSTYNDFMESYDNWFKGGTLEDRLRNSINSADRTLDFYLPENENEETVLTETLKNLEDRIKDFEDVFDVNGDDGIDADHEKLSQEAAQENLSETVDSTIEDLETIQEAYDKYIDAIGDAIDGINDLIDERLSDYDNIDDYISTRLDQIKLLYGDESYESQIGLMRAQQDSYSGRIETDKAAKDAQKAIINELESIKTTYGTLSEEQQEQLKKAEDAYEEYSQDLLDVETKSLENLQAIKEAEINKIVNGIDSLFGSEGYDLDWLDSQWELATQTSEQYYDDYNRAFEIQKLQLKYQDLLNNTEATSLATQQKITNQMNQQLSYLQNKTNLSEYDVKYAQQQLEILQKQIALEDAQANKSQMRLQRNAAGNYDFVYAADEDTVNEAESSLIEAQQEAYNLSKDAYLNTYQNALDAAQRAKEMIVEIATDASLTSEQQAERIQYILDNLKTYLDGSSEELGEIVVNLYNDVANAENLIAEENLGNLATIFENMKDQSYNLLDDIDDRFSLTVEASLQSANTINSKIDELFLELASLLNEYEIKVKQTLESCGDTYDSFITNSLDEAVKSTERLNEGMESFRNNIAVMQEALAAATNGITAYGEGISDVMKKAKEYVAYATQLQDENAKKASAGDSPQTIENGKYTALNEGANFGWSTNYKLTDPDAYFGDENITNIDGERIQDILTAADGVAGNIIMGYVNNKDEFSWDGMNEEQTMEYLTEKYDKTFADLVHGIVWMFTNGWGQAGTANEEYSLAYLKEHFDKGYYYQFTKNNGFDTGGYTGSWADGNSNWNNGKLAVLHQKELVLNADDTQNILDAVNIMRALSIPTLKGLSEKVSSKTNDNTVEQRVEINATFPGVSEAIEIKQALLGLADNAYQLAARD